MDRHKYPRTKHLPWSPGRTDDDKVLRPNQPDLLFGDREVVVTEKLDGENCTIYSTGYTHARSLDSKGHESRDWVKALAARLAYDLPEGWRVCGENLYAQHSLGYDRLPGSYFVVFSIWNEHNECLSWDETCEWAAMMDLPTVPVLYRGEWDAKAIQASFDGSSAFGDEGEGYVVRLADGFVFKAFSTSVAKYVRPNHVQTDTHWMQSAVVPNGLG